MGLITFLLALAGFAQAQGKDMFYGCSCTAVYNKADSCQMIGQSMKTGKFETEVKKVAAGTGCTAEVCRQNFARSWGPRCFNFTMGLRTWEKEGTKFAMCACGMSPKDKSKCRMNGFRRDDGKIEFVDKPNQYGSDTCGEAACGVMFPEYAALCGTYFPGAMFIEKAD